MAENANTISSQVSGIAQNLITELSGKNQIFSKKVIDNIFAFVGLAGGVGTSTIVANVAKSLSRKGFSVVIVDLNICSPIQHIYYKIEQKAKKPDLVSLLSGENKLGESLELKDGVSVLYANNRILFDKVVMDSPGTSANFSSVIEQLSSLYDVVLLDVPSHGELSFEITNMALFKSDVIIAVMDENIGCIGSYNRLERNLSYVGISTQNIHVIMNKRTNITYPTSVFKQLDIELDVLLPYELSIVESGLRGNIYIDKGASSSVTATQFLEAIDELRDVILRLGGYEDKKMAAVAEKKEKKAQAKAEAKSQKQTKEKKDKKGLGKGKKGKTNEPETENESSSEIDDNEEF